MSTLASLEAIRDQHGTLTPALVVDAARDPQHPLHDRFDWNDTVAAHKWRLEQAAQLIRVVKLPAPKGQPQHLRAYVNVRGHDTRSGEYLPTTEAMSDEFTRRLVLRAMEREWKALKSRYEHMREFAEMVTRDLSA